MPKAESVLKFLLRANGWLAVGAVFWVLMPHSWLVACVHAVEPELPVTLVVSYLARMVSGLYMLFGILLIACANDVRKYRNLIRLGMYWCWLMGISLLVHALPYLSILKDQPFFWFILCDGLYGMVITVWILILLRKVE